MFDLEGMNMEDDIVRFISGKPNIPSAVQRWAKNWLSGKDRSTVSAFNAAEAVLERSQQLNADGFKATREVLSALYPLVEEGVIMQQAALAAAAETKKHFNQLSQALDKVRDVAERAAYMAKN